MEKGAKEIEYRKKYIPIYLTKSNFYQFSTLHYSENTILHHPMSSKDKKHKTLTEKPGVLMPEKTNLSAVKRIQLQRAKTISTAAYVKQIQRASVTYLSKAITLIESQREEDQKKAQDIIKACLPLTGKSLRIGITGVPGAGKSTFIEAFGKLLTDEGKKVAVLAVDPSSSLHKGSILGDKTRMEKLVQNPDVFIRPSSTGTTLGGVAKKTRESVLLCESAGYDVILIETVGVGQNEIAVHAMVDFFLLLKIAGAGDELQGIKRGIIEMADLIVINKADKENIKAAELAKNDFEKALHLYPVKSNEWAPKVLTASALNNKGIDKIWQVIQDFEKLTKANGSFDINRNQQEEFWLYDTINDSLQQAFYKDPKIETLLKEKLQLISQKKATPYEVAFYLLNLGKKST